MSSPNKFSSLILGDVVDMLIIAGLPSLLIPAAILLYLSKRKPKNENTSLARPLINDIAYTVSEIVKAPINTTFEIRSFRHRRKYNMTRTAITQVKRPTTPPEFNEYFPPKHLTPPPFPPSTLPIEYSTTFQKNISATTLTTPPSNKKYKAKTQFLSHGEKEFFEALQRVQTQQPHLIFSKPRIADFISAKAGYRTADGSKIGQKHVDFLFCCSQSSRPKLVIELDGSSHNTTTRIERDQLVDAICEDAGIPILHIKRAPNYDIEHLQQLINQKLQ